jgi:hypothetical protein
MGHSCCHHAVGGQATVGRQATAHATTHAGQQHGTAKQGDDRREAAAILALGKHDSPHQSEPGVPQRCHHNNCLWTAGSAAGWELCSESVWFGFYHPKLAGHLKLAGHANLDAQSVQALNGRGSPRLAPPERLHRLLPLRSHLALSILLI